ncbi:uroporphyrinogen-III C-methyltransferase [Alcaligenaceae bacterium]|nr:uroporphyrinogen-III C-methyltransferase [Alcaligenaceae bacterium]
MTDKKTELQPTPSSAPGMTPVETQSGADSAVSKNERPADSINRANTSSDTSAAGKPSAATTGSGVSGPGVTSKTSSPSGSRTASGGSGGPGTPGGLSASSPSKPSRQRSITGPVLVVVVLLALVMAAAWWYQRQEFLRTSTELQSQVRRSADQASQAAEQARQALAKVEQQARKMASLEQAVDAARDQSDGLERAFQTLTDSGSELVLLNDIEHLLTIAQQQLQLSGNIANAIISLETAQAQLARANRPGLASLQQTINGDLDHLRAATTVDIAMLSSQLDELGQLVSSAPLLMPDDAAPEPLDHTSASAASQAADNGSEAPVDPDAPWWKKSMHVASTWSREAWSAIGQDLGQFIAVRRVDDTTALLMSPEQSARFRENLRMRIMTAQLALMMRQPKIWQTETAALVQAIETRFDQQAPQSRRAVKLARQFADTSIAVPVPNVDNSLQAVQTLRDQKSKSERLGTGAPETDQSGTDNANGAAPSSSPRGAADNVGTTGAHTHPATPGDQTATTPSASTTSPTAKQPAASEARPQPDTSAPAQNDGSVTSDASTTEVAPAAGAAADTDTSVSALLGVSARLVAGTTPLFALQG